MKSKFVYFYANNLKVKFTRIDLSEISGFFSRSIFLGKLEALKKGHKAGRGRPRIIHREKVAKILKLGYRK